MAIYNKRISLSTNFFIFGLLSFAVILLFFIGFWVQTYHEELEKKRGQLADESARISSVLSDTMDYITQYTAFIGEKIVQHDNPSDLKYIASLISGSADDLSSENKFYFTTTFDWVTPDKMLRVSNKIGILPKPFDMSERDYLRRTPQYPWTLQLSPPRVGGISKQWIVPAGMGVINERGQFLGSITLGFALKGLEQRISRMLGHTPTEYLVLTRELKPVLDSSIDNGLGPNPDFPTLSFDSEMLSASGYLSKPIVYNKREFSHFRSLAGYPYIILSGYPVSMASVLFNEIVLSRGLALFGVVIATFAMFSWMRRHFIKPVMALSDAADHIRQGQKVAIAESTIHEINVLGAELEKISEYIQNEQRINGELGRKTAELETATKEALAARDSAIKASQAKSEFLANMSHELRTPLNAIVGLTSIMLLRKHMTPERQQEYLETMQVSSQTLLDLINNLLDIAKIESEHIELEKTSFNFRDVLDEVVRMLALRAQEKGIAFSSHYDDAMPTFISGDTTRIKQILINLASNAIKFTERGNVTIDVRPSADKSRILLNVFDTGIGIPPDKLESIFDKFSQADSSITRKYGGTGLGLALTKTLVECMGGQISVTSALQKGSSFLVSIPLLLPPVETADAKAGAEIESHAALRSSTGNQPVVLLVEDHKANILVTSNLLDNLGCRYDIAYNGKEAIEKAAAVQFDLILMDVQMPDMDGFNATRRIREAEKAADRAPVPIIGLTAYALMDDREKCIKAGMNDYLSKPVDIKRFNELVLHFIGKHYPMVTLRAEEDTTSQKMH